MAKKIRNDNLVLRVSSLEYANKIIDFVRNEDYFKDNDLSPNPFLYNIDNIGLAVDGGYSYNSQVANLIRDYITKKQLSRSLDNVNMKDFNKFISSLPENKNENIQEINELIISSTNKESSLQDYVNHFKKSSEKYKINFNSEVLDFVIYTTICNHGINQAFLATQLYLTKGESKGFSRFNKDDKNRINLREKISKIKPKIIKEYFNIKIPNVDMEAQIEVYIDSILEKYHINVASINKI